MTDHSFSSTCTSQANVNQCDHMNIPSPTKVISTKSAPLATTGKASSNQPAASICAHGSPDKASENKGLTWGQVKSKSVTSNYVGEASHLNYNSDMQRLEAESRMVSVGDANSSSNTSGNEAPGNVAVSSTYSASTCARGLNRKSKNSTGNVNKGSSVVVSSSGSGTKFTKATIVAQTSRDLQDSKSVGNITSATFSMTNAGTASAAPASTSKMATIFKPSPKRNGIYLNGISVSLFVMVMPIMPVRYKLFAC